jgi:hypothetical protein
MVMCPYGCSLNVLCLRLTASLSRVSNHSINFSAVAASRPREEGSEMRFDRMSIIVSNLP